MAHPCQPYPDDAYGARYLGQLIEHLEPDVLLIVFDILLYYAYQPMLRHRFPRLATILYTPIDGDEADARFLEPLRHLRRLVVFTDFGRRVLEDAAKRWTSDIDLLTPLEVIPHGIDTSIFGTQTTVNVIRTEAVRVEARRFIFPDQPALEEAFVVLNANHNNRRKRIDLTLEGFAQFAREKPNRVMLYLHMNLAEPGCELLPIARRLGIEHRLLWRGGACGHPSLPDTQLNALYCACDVGLNTSVGEGWGLIAFEHAATGAAQVLPRHSVHEELWAESADLLRISKRYMDRHHFVTHSVVDTQHVAESLERLYADRAHRVARSHQALQRAGDPSLSWSRIAEQWHHTLQVALE